MIGVVDADDEKEVDPKLGDVLTYIEVWAFGYGPDLVHLVHEVRSWSTGLAAYTDGLG